MQVKVIVFIGLFIFTGAAEGRQLAGNSLLVKAVSLELSTDVTSVWTSSTEASSTSTVASVNTRPGTVTSGPPNICENESSADYIFPNPEDCTTFYLCSNGVPYLYNCPSGLVYNDAINRCDYPYNVSPPCGN